MTEFNLVVSFPDESPSFVNGFEAGQIWTQLDTGIEEIKSTYHTENIEVIRRMAVAKGYEMETKPTEFEEWTEVTLLKNKAAPKTPNPYGFKVVS